MVWIKALKLSKVCLKMLTHFLRVPIKLLETQDFGGYRACVCPLSAAYRAITKDDFDNLSVILPGTSYFSTIRSFVCQGSKHTYSAYLWQEFITKRDSAEHMGRNGLVLLASY